MLEEDQVIDRITAERGPHYEPFGWHHWPEHPWFSYQFRRGLGETQEGGGAVSECFQVASRIVPGDHESWHREWLRVAERTFARAEEEERRGHVRTAMNGYLRAADYFRQAEFFLPPDDPRRLATFTRMERSSRGFLRLLTPPGEALERMRCPYLIVHGGYDVLGMSQARKVHDYARAHGVNVTLRFVTPEETGAEHCQHDNPTIGQELMADWLADVFGLDQRALAERALAPLL